MVFNAPEPVRAVAGHPSKDNMPFITATSQNACSWTIEGELDISAGAAVVAIRGDGLSAVKGTTGQYLITLKNTSALQLVELLGREANFTGATFPATALGVTMTTVVQNATTGDITITLVTTANPTSGAPTDGAAAVTVAFECTIRTCKLVSPL